MITMVPSAMNKNLPEHTIMFVDDEETAMARLPKLEENLRVKGYEVIKPYNLFKITYPEYTLLAFELRRVS